MTKLGWLVAIHRKDINSQLFIPDDNFIGNGVILGREKNCDIVIDDPYISRQHCLILFYDHNLQVIDLGSKNKVFIAEKLIEENKRTVWPENIPLRLGDKIIGTEIIVKRIELKNLPLNTIIIDKNKLNSTPSYLEETELVKDFSINSVTNMLVSNLKRQLSFIHYKKIIAVATFILLISIYFLEIIKNNISKHDNYINQINIPSIFINEKAKSIVLDRKYQNVNFGNFFALVIGNNNYQYVDKLENAIMDADEVSSILSKNYKFEVTKIINGTRNDILSELDIMRNRLTIEDNLLIFFAGHGLYDQESDRGYWLPIDAQPYTRANWISNADITDAIKAMKAKHVIVIADSCYAGSLTRSIEMTHPLLNINVVERINGLRSRTVLASGGIEPVIDGGGKTIKTGNIEIKHSIFTSAFIDTLNNNESIIDGSGLFNQLRDLVRLNTEQMPVYDNIRNADHEVGGDFLFVRK